MVAAHVLGVTVSFPVMAMVSTLMAGEAGAVPLLPSVRSINMLQSTHNDSTPLGTSVTAGGVMLRLTDVPDVCATTVADPPIVGAGRLPCVLIWVEDSASDVAASSILAVSVLVAVDIVSTLSTSADADSTSSANATE